MSQKGNNVIRIYNRLYVFYRWYLIPTEWFRQWISTVVVFDSKWFRQWTISRFQCVCTWIRQQLIPTMIDFDNTPQSLKIWQINWRRINRALSENNLVTYFILIFFTLIKFWKLFCSILIEIINIHIWQI